MSFVYTVCLKTAIWFFLVKTGWQPWE